MYNHEQRAAIRSDIAWGRLLNSFSLSRALIKRARGQPLDGVEGEVNAEIERTQIANANGSVLVPWSILARDTRALQAGAGSGGYLIATENLGAADALRPKMICGSLGQTFVEAPHGSTVNLPRQTGAGTAYWLSSETAQASQNEQAFGQVSFTPKTVGAYTELSRLLKIQTGGNADAIIARDLTAVLGRAIDYNQLHGSGLAGQMLGITNTPGVSTFSAASCSTATLTDAQVSLNDSLGDTTGVATTLTAAGTLRKRSEFVSGSAAMWQGPLYNGRLIGMPARSSTAVAAGSLIVGSWEYLNLVIWGELEISVNPYAGFQSGKLGIRAMMTCDSGVTWPSAFNVGSSFS